MKESSDRIRLLAALYAATVITGTQLINEAFGITPHIAERLTSSRELTRVQAFAKPARASASGSGVPVSETVPFVTAGEYKRVSGEQLHGVTKVADLAVEQAKFRDWLLANTAVTSVHFEQKQLIWVQLSPEKYTSKANVERIAADIARWYARRTGQKAAICTVWRGNQIYAKGSYFGE